MNATQMFGGFMQTSKSERQLKQEQERQEQEEKRRFGLLVTAIIDVCKVLTPVDEIPQAPNLESQSNVIHANFYPPVPIPQAPIVPNLSPDIVHRLSLMDVQVPQSDPKREPGIVEPTQINLAPYSPNMSSEAIKTSLGIHVPTRAESEYIQNAEQLRMTRQKKLEELKAKFEAQRNKENVNAVSLVSPIFLG